MPVILQSYNFVTRQVVLFPSPFYPSAPTNKKFSIRMPFFQFIGDSYSRINMSACASPRKYKFIIAHSIFLKDLFHQYLRKLFHFFAYDFYYLHSIQFLLPNTSSKLDVPPLLINGKWLTCNWK